MATTASQGLVAWVREQLAESHPDVLRALLERFVAELMSADVDAVCGAEYRHSSARPRASPQRLPTTALATRGLGPLSSLSEKLRQGT